ncbi:MAG: hypothetical protein DMF72_13835 [Acidobacteria bacterium]|nr:MAG: hypothetical protein DMF72_13835 [Acidobacteriota bacterium]
MNQADFEALLDDQSKVIQGDIRWADDEDHSPSVEFRAEVDSETGHPIFIRGSYNALAQTLTYALIHRGSGRIYALDLGKDHHNPDCQNVGERHKHRWREPVRDKEAYVPLDLDAPVNDPLQVWEQFCAEASIHHNGEMHPPPAPVRFP